MKSPLNHFLRSLLAIAAVTFHAGAARADDVDLFKLQQTNFVAAIADFNADQQFDLITNTPCGSGIYRSGSCLTVLLNNGANRFDPVQNFAPSSAYASIVRLIPKIKKVGPRHRRVNVTLYDIITERYSAKPSRVRYSGRPDGTFSGAKKYRKSTAYQSPLLHPPYPTAGGDLDGDAVSEIIEITEASEGEFLIRITLSRNAAVSEHRVLAEDHLGPLENFTHAVASLRLLDTIDFDYDGDYDGVFLLKLGTLLPLLGSTDKGVLLFYQNDGTANLAAPKSVKFANGDARIASLGFTDLNTDGKPELLYSYVRDSLHPGSYEGYHGYGTVEFR